MAPLPQLRTLSLALQARVNQRTTLIELVALVEGTCGWAIGSAWRGYVDSHFHTSEFPAGVAVVCRNAWTALQLTAFGAAWLVVTGPPSLSEVAAASSRAEVERFFLTNAMSFFVGTSWNAVARDIAAIMGAAAASVGGLQLCYAVEGITASMIGPGVTISIILLRRSTWISRRRYHA